MIGVGNESCKINPVGGILVHHHVGNGGDHRLVEDVDGPVTLTARTGDRVYFLRDGASVTLPSAAANSCRLTMKNLGASGVGVAAAPGGAIDRRASIRVAPGQTVEMISDGSTWWTL